MRSFVCCLFQSDWYAAGMVYQTAQRLECLLNHFLSFIPYTTHYIHPYTTQYLVMQAAYDTIGPDPTTGIAGRSCHWVLDKQQDWVESVDAVDSGAPSFSSDGHHKRMCDIMRTADEQQVPILHSLITSPHYCTAIAQGDCLCDPRYKACEF